MVDLKEEENCRSMDKGREVFRQADVFLQIAAENGLVPKAQQEPEEVRYMRLRRLKIEYNMRTFYLL